MKKFILFLSGGLVWLLAGCATTPVAVAPVGPDPVGGKSVASTGTLEVFSRMTTRYDDQNQAGDGEPGWRQHTDYGIYHPNGKLVKHVGNAIGHYELGPVQVVLPPGKYLVKAKAKDYLWVEVPVVIQPGRTTMVHLDDDWKLPPDVPKSKLVTMPNGNPVGWRAGPVAEFGIN